MSRRRRARPRPRHRARLSARPSARAARPAERRDRGFRAGDRRHSRSRAVGALPAGGGAGAARAPGGRRRHQRHAPRPGRSQAVDPAGGDAPLPHRAARRRLPAAARRADRHPPAGHGARIPAGGRGVPPPARPHSRGAKGARASPRLRARATSPLSAPPSSGWRSGRSPPIASSPARSARRSPGNAISPPRFLFSNALSWVRPTPAPGATPRPSTFSRAPNSGRAATRRRRGISIAWRPPRRAPRCAPTRATSRPAASSSSATGRAPWSSSTRPIPPSRSVNGRAPPCSRASGCAGSPATRPAPARLLDHLATQRSWRPSLARGAVFAAVSEIVRGDSSERPAAPAADGGAHRRGGPRGGRLLARPTGRAAERPGGGRRPLPRSAAGTAVPSARHGGSRAPGAAGARAGRRADRPAAFRRQEPGGCLDRLDAARRERQRGPSGPPARQRPAPGAADARACGSTGSRCRSPAGRSGPPCSSSRKSGSWRSACGPRAAPAQARHFPSQQRQLAFTLAHQLDAAGASDRAIEVAERLFQGRPAAAPRRVGCGRPAPAPLPASLPRRARQAGRIQPRSTSSSWPP